MTGLLPSDPLPGRSDRAPSSFGEVILPSMIQLLSGDDRAFARSNFYRGTIRFLSSNPPPGRSDRASSSFGEVILPSAIQLLSGRSGFCRQIHPLVEAIGHHRHLER
ncbi:hypothetical protein E6C27_scaffold550G00680 [Cucumis melo var. makuwa]|uniref:Uncharacterized protein n=1 Tax=Cucumis melo var. makuwa TaxID=1194695 RepID=A0A5A7VIG8_CUCMM|nr:hypothetical protein E6C27_scaffold550G00680 [Cucumis melo var. makuwa]